MTSLFVRQGRWHWFTAWFSAESAPSISPRNGADDRAPSVAPRADLTTLTVGETREFERFFQQHQRRLFGYLWRATGDEQVAYDLSQETFIRAWQHFAAVTTYERPDAWLLRVATNLVINQQRRRSNAVGRATPLDVDTDPSSSDPTVRFAERDLVQTVLNGMAPRSRVALILREIHGFSCAEVAEALGISRSATKMVLFRAREEFRARYQREGGEQR